MSTSRRLACLVIASALGAGCATGDGSELGSIAADAGVPPQDASAPRGDAGQPADSGLPPEDSGVPLPDAGPTPDAGPEPDAAPTCTDQTGSLLANGDFDSGSAPWVESSGGGFSIVTPDFSTPYNGTHVAWLGGYLPGGSDIIHQVITVPADATDLTVSGFWLMGSEESNLIAWDLAEIQVRDSGGTILEVVASIDNTDVEGSWQSFSFQPVGNYAGQTIRISMAAVTDATNNTNFVFDGFDVTATFCQ